MRIACKFRIIYLKNMVEVQDMTLADPTCCSSYVCIQTFGFTFQNKHHLQATGEPLTCPESAEEATNWSTPPVTCTLAEKEQHESWKLLEFCGSEATRTCGCLWRGCNQAVDA